MSRNDLYLKLIDEDDLADVCKIRNSCIDMLHGEPRTIEQTKEWFEKDKPMWFIIKKKENIEVYDESCPPGQFRLQQINKTVGYFRLKIFWIPSDLIGAEIGCDIHPKYRRQGIAEWTYRTMLDRLFGNTYGIDEAELFVLTDNKPAIKLYEKLGFKYLVDPYDGGGQIINYNGKLSYHMAITGGQWLSQS